MGLMPKRKKKNEDEPLADDATADSLDDGAGDDEPKKSKKKKAKKEKKEKTAAAGGGAKQFFIEHGEKVGLGVVAACLLLMIWSAFGRERLPENRSPDNLQTKAASRETEIKNSELPKIAASGKRYSQAAGDALEPLDPDDYVSGTSLFPVTLFGPQKTSKRGDPELLPPENAIAAAGVGLIISSKERDLLGLSFQERRELERQKALEAEKLRKEEEQRRLREKRLKDKREKENRRSSNSRDRRREKEEAERLARIRESRQPEKTEWPLPSLYAEQGVTPPAEIDDGEIIAVGRHWISVLMLAPRHKQQKLYDEAFLQAVGHNPVRDQPDYLGVRLQRLEIPENAADEALDWSKAQEWSFREQIEAMQEQQKTWVGQADQVVADAFYHPKLNQPLGPLLMDSWEPWAVHPEVMLKGEQASTDTGEFGEPELDEPTETEEPDSTDPFGFGTAAAEEQENELSAGRSGRGGPTRIRPGGEFEGEGGGRVDVSIEPVGKFYQIRVFDYTVKPGKKYRYRAQLAVKNPNSKAYNEDAVPPAFLANLSTRDVPWKPTDWSEPTNLAVVPIGQQAFAGPVNLPEEDDDFQEAYATVITRVINFGKGTVTTALFDVYRGGMVSGITEGFEIDPIDQLVRRQEDSLIETDLLLLDMRGGPKTIDEVAGLSIEEGRPAEMLFLDSKGNLHVRSELDDADEMVKFKIVAGEDVSLGGETPGPGPNPLPDDAIFREGEEVEGPNIFGPGGRGR